MTISIKVAAARSALLISVALTASPSLVSAQSGSTPGTYGYVFTIWDYALEQTPDGKRECPNGLAPSDLANFKALSPDQQQELQRKYGWRWNRGTHGELGYYVPMAVTDTLPFHTISGDTGYGLNLDDTTDGRATPKTCKHAKLTSPAGEKVDNQFYRAVGCTKGYRMNGAQQAFLVREFQTDPDNRLLMELSGVDDLKNDPEVSVRFYKGIDRLQQDGAGNFLPYTSHRVDRDLPQYTMQTRGRIVDGELITDPIKTARFPIHYSQMPATRLIYGMRVRLKLEDTKATGLVAGYEDIKNKWNYMARGVGSGTDVGDFSPAGLYRAVEQYADGDPDPATGQCRSISIAYQVEAARAFIIKGEPGAATAQASARSSAVGGK